MEAEWTPEKAAILKIADERLRNSSLTNFQIFRPSKGR